MVIFLFYMIVFQFFVWVVDSVFNGYRSKGLCDLVKKDDFFELVGLVLFMVLFVSLKFIVSGWKCLFRVEEDEEEDEEDKKFMFFLI